MTLLKILFFTFSLAILQTSIFIPVFKNLVFSPQISLLFLWIFGKSLKDSVLIVLSFILALFFDALSNMWGAYILTNVLFTYILTVLRNTLIVKKLSYEFFLIIPFLLVLYKCFLFFLFNLRTEINFSFQAFAYSSGIEVLFILLFYKIKKNEV